MDRLHLMTVFVAVAEAESFNGGARKLGLSAPAVTRAIASLEARLKVKLLSRTTRYVRVTEAGARYLADAKSIINAVDEADEASAGINAIPRGELTVTAPVQFGKLIVTPLILEYLRLYPEMQVSALLLDRVVNLIDEGIDVAIRIGELPDSSMQAIRVGEVRRMVCASQQYLQQNPSLKTPQDLAHHTLIAAKAISAGTDWRFQENNHVNAVKINPRLSISSIDAAVEAVRSGFGVSQLMSYQIAPYLADGSLKALLTDYELTPLPVHVLHREGRYSSAKVRSFVDLLVSNLRANQVIHA